MSRKRYTEHNSIHEDLRLCKGKAKENENGTYDIFFFNSFYLELDKAFHILQPYRYKVRKLDFTGSKLYGNFINNFFPNLESVKVSGVTLNLITFLDSIKKSPLRHLHCEYVYQPTEMQFVTGEYGCYSVKYTKMYHDKILEFTKECKTLESISIRLQREDSKTWNEDTKELVKTFLEHPKLYKFYIGARNMDHWPILLTKKDIELHIFGVPSPYRITEEIKKMYMSGKVKAEIATIEHWDGYRTDLLELIYYKLGWIKNFIDKNTVKESVIEIKECPICYEPYQEETEEEKHAKWYVTNCQHVFHQSCLFSWYESQNNKTCPFCRKEYLN